MLYQAMGRLQYDFDYTLDNAASDIADVFSDPAKMQENYSALDGVQSYLKVSPELSRQLFDELIRRHNFACGAATDAGSQTFIPGCCCCGLDPYIGSSWPAPVRWPGSNLMHGGLVGDV